jgi:hypothetical protein
LLAFLVLVFASLYEAVRVLPTLLTLVEDEEDEVGEADSCDGNSSELMSRESETAIREGLPPSDSTVDKDLNAIKR